MNRPTDLIVQPPVPPLEFVPPSCSLCGKETEVEQHAFWCTGCGLEWTRESAHLEPGRWIGPAVARCTASDQPWSEHTDLETDESLRTRVYRCYLPLEHGNGSEQADGTVLHLCPEHPERGWSGPANGPRAGSSLAGYPAQGTQL